MEENKEYTIDSSHRSVLGLHELWRYRELFYFFTWRDIKIKYKQTVLGFLWAILQPLFMMIIFTLFFGKALNHPEQSLPYPIYVLSGLLMWNIFASGLSNAANSMVSNASIIKKIYFPRLIVPVSSILGALVDFLISFFLFGVMLIIYDHPVSWTALCVWPASLLVCTVAALGLGSWLAALNVKYRDFRYVIPFLLQIMFFTAPVIYPVSLIQYPLLRYVLAASPMYAVIELFRAPLTEQHLDILLMIISLGSGLLFLIIGLYYFKRTEDFFADFA